MKSLRSAKLRVPHNAPSARIGWRPAQCLRSPWSRDKRWRRRDQSASLVQIFGGLLAANVLLARGRGQHKAAAAFLIVDAHQPSICRAYLSRVAGPTYGPPGKTGTPNVAPQPPQCRRRNAGRSQQAEDIASVTATICARHARAFLAQRLQIFDATKEVWRLHCNGRRLIVKSNQMR